ncbi:MAG: hypothetical protein GF400_02560, partial [Candidatus Eisenbacteria bacterium]|nr:hypothetical protein [Candidatus Eisenbacteria bacterium]
MGGNAREGRERSVSYRMRKTISVQAVFIVFLVVSLAAAAQAALPHGWVSLDRTTTQPEAPRLQLLDSTESGLSLRVSVPGFECETVDHGGAAYQKLELPGYWRTEAIGSPWIPVVRQLIAIPEGADVTVRVTAGDPVTYEGCLLYPVPKEVKGDDRAWMEFAFDASAYSQRGYYPAELGAVEMTGVLRGQGVALIAYRPVQYDPSSRQLRVYSEATVDVSFVGGRGGLSENLGPLNRTAEELLPNFTSLGGTVELSGTRA